MTLISYIAFPVKSANGEIIRFRINLTNNDILLQDPADSQYYLVESIQDIANELVDIRDEHKEDCEGCDKCNVITVPEEYIIQCQNENLIQEMEKISLELETSSL